jgi:hypothetical protein
MSVTIDCGEGKHTVCSGSGTQPYLIPQEAGPRFFCGCPCHHGGEGVPCSDPVHNDGKVAPDDNT